MSLLYPQFNFCSKCLNSLYSSTIHWLTFSRQLDGLGVFIKKNRTLSDSYGQSKCHVYSFRRTNPNSNMNVFAVCLCVCDGIWFAMGVWSGTRHKQLFCQGVFLPPNSWWVCLRCWKSCAALHLTLATEPIAGFSSDRITFRNICLARIYKASRSWIYLPHTFNTVKHTDYNAYLSHRVSFDVTNTRMIMTLTSKLLPDYWRGTIPSLLATQSPLTNVQYFVSACPGLCAADYTCIQIGIAWTLVTDTHAGKKMVSQQGHECVCGQKNHPLRLVGGLSAYISGLNTWLNCAHMLVSPGVRHMRFAN